MPMLLPVAAAVGILGYLAYDTFGGKPKKGAARPQSPPILNQAGQPRKNAEIQLAARDSGRAPEGANPIAQHASEPSRSLSNLAEHPVVTLSSPLRPSTQTRVSQPSPTKLHATEKPFRKRKPSTITYSAILSKSCAKLPR